MDVLVASVYRRPDAVADDDSEKADAQGDLSPPLLATPCLEVLDDGGTVVAFVA